MTVERLDECGLSQTEREFLQSHGIDHCFFARVMDSISNRVHAVPLVRLWDSVYLAYLVEFRDPGVVRSSDGDDVVFDQYESFESLHPEHRYAEIALRFFNSECHDLISCYNEALALTSRRSLLDRLKSLLP